MNIVTILVIWMHKKTR